MMTLIEMRTQMKTQRYCTTRHSLVLQIAAALVAAGPLNAQTSEAYPFGPQLRVLAQDVVNPDYQEIVWGMFTTGLAAEWKRVATPDNYVSFIAAHGGLGQVQADAALKEAYENRKQVADGFVDLMRQAYERKQTSPDFTSEQVRELLATVKQEGLHSRPGRPLWSPAAG